jgi:hypothetical protein
MVKPKDMNIKPSMCDLIVAIKNRIQKQSCRDFLMVKPKDMNIKPSMCGLTVAIKNRIQKQSRRDYLMVNKKYNKKTSPVRANLF